MKAKGARMIDRRTFLGGMLGACALGALPACGLITAEDPGSADIESARPLAISLIAPATLDPHGAQDESALTFAWQLFDSLTSYDFFSGELSCLAAERFEASEDARTFTFHVRDAVFHNGEAVTAEDFKRAWERIVNPASAATAAAGASSSLASMLSVIEGFEELRQGSASELAGVTCPDAQTLRVTLRTPYADFPYVLAHPALGPVPAAAEDDAEAFARQPIGNGPFRLAAAWEPDASVIELVRFEDYTGELATLSSVRVELAKDIEEGYQLFQTGDADMCRCPVREASGAASSHGRPEDGNVMMRGRRFVCCAGLATSMLACNCLALPLDNADVRRALSLAIDRDYLAGTLYRETRIAADGVIPPAVKGYRETAWPYAALDRERAEELLEASYPVVEEGMRGLTVRLLYHADGGHREIIEAIVENLAAVGVVCEAEGVELEELRRRVAARDFDLVRMDWATDAPVMDGVLFPLFFSGNDASTNVSGYRDDSVDEQLAEARTVASETTRISLLQDVDSTVGRDCPVIPLMFQATPYVGSERVEELSIDPQGRVGLATAQLGD